MEFSVKGLDPTSQQYKWMYHTCNNGKTCPLNIFVEPTWYPIKCKLYYQEYLAPVQGHHMATTVLVSILEN